MNQLMLVRTTTVSVHRLCIANPRLTITCLEYYSVICWVDCTCVSYSRQAQQVQATFLMARGALATLAALLRPQPSSTRSQTHTHTCVMWAICTENDYT